MAYYTQHKGRLEGVVKKYRDALDMPKLIGANEYAIFNTIHTGITKHSLRYYQMEALFVLDRLYQDSLLELANKEKKPNYKIHDYINELLSEIEDKKKAPFIAYEMATGSGKTMLMGACIYFLNKKYGIDNFLIITPASTDIYQKTIRNFDIGNFESVWADDTPFTFNLISGDNYTQNLFYNENKDANIFIFNISKFGKNATNTEKTWESAVWQDDNGNSISIRQYLKDKKLVIITDEAHHAQSRTANTIIKNFHPISVLEFTATAIENAAGDNRRSQNIVYKYDIRRFLEDGHGKLVRALALASVERQRRGSFNENEKLKLVTLLLVHLLKKQAVLLDPKCRGLKPVCFVKVKEETSFTQKVYDYIRNELSGDVDNIKIILEKVKEQDLEITELIQTIYKTVYEGKLNLLQRDIQKVADTAIFYYGKSDKETEKKFLNIRKNEVELVVYMQRLDEGIDLPNIYSMAVINDSDTDFHTSVKQIIGRGVRLNKENREYDESEDKLQANAEKLHIICDQGKNFDQVILKIQHEFGLNKKHFCSEEKKKSITNKVKTELLENKYIPHIRADFKVRDGVSLMGLLKDVETVTNNFIENNCFEGKNDNIKKYVKYRPDGFFIEVDIFTDKVTFHEHIAGDPRSLSLGDEQAMAIYGMVQKHLHCLPDSEATRSLFKDYIKRFNNIGLKYFHLSDADEKLVKNFFVSAFSFYFRNHIECNYYRLDYRQMREDDKLSLKKRFIDYDIKIPDNEINNKTRTKNISREDITKLIEGQYHFYGYEKSVYDYDKFDSYTEYQFAEYINMVLSSLDGDGSISVGVDGIHGKKISVKDAKAQYNVRKDGFWIKNQRNIYFTYGSRKYYPDFIVFKDGYIYVIETKGEIYSDTKKNQLLKKIDEVPGEGEIKGYKGLLIFSSQMDDVIEDNIDFIDFISEASKNLEIDKMLTALVQDPPSEEWYVKYIPAYSEDKAYKKFIKKGKTAKHNGWLEVEQVSGNYSETAFAVQIRGNALNPDYENGQWVVFNHVSSLDFVSGALALLKIDGVYHGYKAGYTIRSIDVVEEKKEGEMFAVKRIVVHGVKEKGDSVSFDYDDDSNAILIGIKFQ